LFTPKTILNPYIKTAALLTVKPDGTYTYRSSLKDLEWGDVDNQSCGFKNKKNAEAACPQFQVERNVHES
jgi:hypothetical protein